MSDALFGKVIRGRTAAPTLRESADVVVIGTGAGGSMALYELARRGLRCIAIERGSMIGPAEMNQLEDRMIPHLFAESGARATVDRTVNILQGQGVGGSTLHNTNLCKRAPAPIIARWRDELGLALDGLEDDYAAVEAMLKVRTVPEDRVNANNHILARGIEALGYRGGRLSENRDDRCQQSGFCELGCAYNGKTNAFRMLIPPAVEAGATVLTDARVDRIEHDGAQATSVRGRLFDPTRNRPIGEFMISARAVVLAGSATGSAALHIASGLPDPHGRAGVGLHLHPGAAVLGLHDDPVEGWRGVPQSVECTEFLDFDPGAAHRVWIVSGFAHPAGAAALLPGFGPSHAALMRQYARASVAIAMVHDETEGRVSPGEGDNLRIRYAMNDDDRAQVALGLRETARLLLAGGARRVVVPLNPPIVVETERDIEQLTVDLIRPCSPTFTAVHPMSTMRMSASPEDGVVDESGRHHFIDNLWIADGSLLPTSIGGPPQVTIYTLGRRVGRAVADALTAGQPAALTAE